MFFSHRRLFSSKKHQLSSEYFKNSQSLLGFTPKELSDIPKVLTGLSGKLAHQSDVHREPINFANELNSIAMHSEKMDDDARLSQVINQIYIPKLKAKFHAPYFYKEGKRFQVIEKKFCPNRDPDEVILGIESSFDESAACLVDSFGNLRSKDVRYT